MSLRFSRCVLAALALAISAGAAQAAAINQVAYGSLTPAQTLDFDSGSGVIDGVTRFGAAQFGERFAGQALSFEGDFDVLSSTASKPLSLLSGAAGQNLVYIGDGIGGMGKAGVDDNGDPFVNALGEGAVSVLFDGDQSEVGFQVFGGINGSKLMIDFFRFDGSLIHSIMLSDLLDGFNGFGFRRDGGVKDIAGISIWNSDPGGLWIDSMAFDVITTRVPGDPGDPGVPEPGVLMLVGMALVAAGYARRRRSA